jgi:hypothetical protein
MIQRLNGIDVSSTAPNYMAYPGLGVKIKVVKEEKPELPPLTIQMKRLLEAIEEEPKAGDARLRRMTGLTLDTIRIYKRQLKPYLCATTPASPTSKPT